MGEVNKIKPLVIIGAGGLGREVAWLVEDINKAALEWDFLGFVDDGLSGKTVEGYPVLGPVDVVMKLDPKPWVVVAIADAKARKRIVTYLSQNGIRLATLIHPTVKMSRYVNIGVGSIICTGSVLTTNIKLGTSSIINPNCFIGHDTVLGDYTSLMPAVKVAGEVNIGEGVFIGLNAAVINRKTVGDWSIIGAGATVIEDIPPHSLAVGTPARVIKELK